MIGNIPAKEVYFSDFICNFAMSFVLFCHIYCITKLNEHNGMTKFQAALLLHGNL